MKLSCCWLYAISKYGYPVAVPDMFKALEEMAALGFHYVELEGMQGRNLREVWEGREALRGRCDELGLKVINFCPVIPDLVSLDPQKREAAIEEEFALAIRIAKYFDCKTIQADSYTPPFEFIGDQPYKDMVSFGLQFRVIIPPDFSWQEQWDVLVDTMARCSRMAWEAGLPFCLEPRVGEIVSNTDGMLRLMEWVDRADPIAGENFGAVLDTGHQHAQKEILPLSVEKLGRRIFYLHVSDNDGRVNEHRALGEGTIDWEGVFRALQKFHFDGFVALDIGRVPDLDESMIRSQDYLRVLFDRMGIPLDESLCS